MTAKPGRPKGRKTSAVWHAVIGRVRKDDWIAALDAHSGNITRAAETVDIHRVYGSKLTKVYGLQEYAKELRIKSTGRDRGRPWGRGNVIT